MSRVVSPARMRVVMRNDRIRIKQTFPGNDTVRNHAGHGVRWVVGLGAAAMTPPVIISTLAARLRNRPDTDAGEILSENLGEKGRYIESFDGARIYTEELGRGPTVVLVHGWFCNTDMWHFQKKELAGRYRLVCFDQRGHRRSECPDGKPFTLEAMAGDLRKVVDTYASDGPVVLVGHSMGGMSILKYAEMYPDELGSRVRGIALVDTSDSPMDDTLLGGTALRYIRRPLVEPIFRFAVEHAGAAERMKQAVIGTSPFLVATRYLGYGSGASLTQLQYISEMVEKTSMKGASLAGLGLFGYDRPTSLDPVRRSGIPVLIWVGEKDKLTRPKVSMRMHAELPASELHVVPDTGHPSCMEVYRTFNRVLREFADRSFEWNSEGDG